MMNKMHCSSNSTLEPASRYRWAFYTSLPHHLTWEEDKIESTRRARYLFNMDTKETFRILTYDIKHEQLPPP